MGFNATLYSFTQYQGQKVSLIFGLVNIHSVIRSANGYIMDLKSCTKNGANLLWFYEYTMSAFVGTLHYASLMRLILMSP